MLEMGSAMAMNLNRAVEFLRPSLSHSICSLDSSVRVTTVLLSVAFVDSVSRISVRILR